MRIITYTNTSYKKEPYNKPCRKPENNLSQSTEKPHYLLHSTIRPRARASRMPQPDWPHIWIKTKNIPLPALPRNTPGILPGYSGDSPYRPIRELRQSPYLTGHAPTNRPWHHQHMALQTFPLPEKSPSGGFRGPAGRNTMNKWNSFRL